MALRSALPWKVVASSIGSGIWFRLGRASMATPSARAADLNSASFPGLDVAA
jgi:hypothetical protein